MGSRLWIVGLIFLVTSACGLFEDRGAAEAAADRFHRLYNEASYSVIYNEADPQFRRANTVPDVDQLLVSMQRSLGLFRQARRTGFQTSGSTVMLVYEADFVKGHATEEFGFVLREGQAYLIKYKIESPSLVVR